MMGKPKIRFKGYNEDWEQRKVGDYLTESREIGNKGDVARKMTVKLWGKGVYEKLEAGSTNTQYFIRHANQFIYSKLDFLNCAFGVVPEELESLETTADVPAFDCVYMNPYFMFYRTIQPSFYIQNGIIANGSRKAKRIHTDTFLEMPISVPCLTEQNKIVGYFQSLDHLITLHQHKCDEMKKLKKCMLQKMFPQNGKKVPEIRFEGFTNDWEQRKLGEVFEQTTNFVNLSKDDIELWSLTVEDGLTPKSERYNREFLVKKDTNFKEVRPGDIVYNPMNMTLGAVGYNGMSKSVAISGYYTTMITKDGNDSYYINTWLKSPQAISLYKIYATGSLIEKQRVQFPTLSTIPAVFPKYEEQHKIGCYFEAIDHLITLHHRKRVILKKTKVSDWEQRKLGEVLKERTKRAQGGEELLSVTIANGVIRQADSEKRNIASEDKSNYKIVRKGDIPYNSMRMWQGAVGNSEYDGIVSPAYTVLVPTDEANAKFFMEYFKKENSLQLFQRWSQGLTSDTWNLKYPTLSSMRFSMPSIEEQNRIASYFEQLDHLITLHHHEEFCTENVLIYIEINKTIQIKEDIMAELESVIEQKLIDQLVYGDSQWTYRADLKTEEDLWNNFRYILVQNNKDRLNGEPLSDTEFEQVKNQLQFSSFYKAGEWLVGENGKVMVHVQRDTERLHLVVMNHEHIAGGSSVYEVINQYRALADEESQTKAQDRRFDVTLMINGLPMIHIELKNKQHSYMDGFWQIKKYIGEGKFTGIFSAVQMFVISNGVDTKYFSAASDTELNSKFISGWLDNENNPVPDYLDFAKSVLRIPEAHEMIARYTVLDEEAKRLILLRPYQIHAIEAIREASKTGKSGFVWHTTGSGKTLTSYKATRNLLMDIPSIDKAIFLIDRKDLDTQTSMAFRTYANNDLVDVDQTDNVFDLKKKLKSDDRQMIVTTIQKLQRLITKN